MCHKRKAGETKGCSCKGIHKVDQSQSTTHAGRKELVAAHRRRELQRLQPGELGESHPEVEQSMHIWSTMVGGRWRRVVGKRRRVEVKEEGVAKLTVSCGYTTASDIALTRLKPAPASRRRLPVSTKLETLLLTSYLAHWPKHQTRVPSRHRETRSSRRPPFPFRRPTRQHGLPGWQGR